MQRSLTAVLCSATFGVALAGTHTLLRGPSPRAAETSVAAHEAARPAPVDIELREELRALTARVGLIEGASGGTARIDRGAIEAIAREVAAELLAGATPAATSDDVASARRPDVADLVAEVLTADDVRQAEVWRRLAAEGRAEEVLAALLARAEADPQDPDKQLELGQAYIARIAEVGNSPLAGTYATQADAAFDRALAVDPEHHSARLHKAVALSFWPPVFGKQGAAIEQFETLIAQQARKTPAPHHAETHLLLGNMYQQTGQRDKALAAWGHGASLFPEHQGLARQLELAQQQQ